MGLPIETLDRTRPFGEVHGESRIFFTQKTKGVESWPYDASDKLMEGELTIAQRAKLAELRKVHEAKVEPHDAKAWQTIVKKDDDEDEPDAVVNSDNDDHDINLVMWLKDPAMYEGRDKEVRKAFKQRYHMHRVDLHAIARHIMEVEKIPRDRVSPLLVPDKS